MMGAAALGSNAGSVPFDPNTPYVGFGGKRTKRPSRKARMAAFVEESKRQALAIAKERQKRKRNKHKTRPTFKEAGAKISRIPQHEFGFGFNAKTIYR